MSCHCSYGYEEGEPCDVWREGQVQRSRKPHRCCECGDVIPAGSRYCYAFSVYDGMPNTFRRCASCATLAELYAELNKSCPLWGGLSEACEYSEPPIDWREWRQKAKSLDGVTP